MVKNDAGLLTSSTETEELVRRFQRGDGHALERLWSRYLPRLKRWAHGRLPPASRDQTDTDDLIQDAFVRTLAHLRTLEPRGAGSAFAYFRTVVLNQLRDHARRAARRPSAFPLEEERHVADEPSPLERIVGAEAVRRYTAALETLSESDQQLLIAFVELRCTDRELAELFEKPTPQAARQARHRALARLVRAMTHADAALAG